MFLYTKRFTFKKKLMWKYNCVLLKYVTVAQFCPEHQNTQFIFKEKCVWFVLLSVGFDTQLQKYYINILNSFFFIWLELLNINN